MQYKLKDGTADLRTKYSTLDVQKYHHNVRLRVHVKCAPPFPGLCKFSQWSVYYCTQAKLQFRFKTNTTLFLSVKKIQFAAILKKKPELIRIIAILRFILFYFRKWQKKRVFVSVKICLYRYFSLCVCCKMFNSTISFCMLHYINFHLESSVVIKRHHFL